jgi:TPR repeat protein
MLPGMVNEYLIAVKAKGKPQPDATLCYVPPENSNNFSPLTHAIAHMYLTGKNLYPVERTLLTTGALSFIMESAYRGHVRIETPMLNVSYKAPEKSYYAHGAGS